MIRPNLDDITIRTDLRPGDIGDVIGMHGHFYSKVYDYGISFETYVAEGLVEFYRKYDPSRNRVWICEHNNAIVGFVLLMHRENHAAQLRYFYLERNYRGIGLGGKLMQLYMEFLKEKKYKSCYLWTTNEQQAAAALYKKHGFILTEEMSSTTFGKALTEQRYELVL